MDFPELNARALAQADVFVSRVTRLDVPTPCVGWDLGDLLRHLVANNHGWAAAAGGAPADQATWEVTDLGDDPVGAFRRSAAAVDAAFARPELPERFEVYGYGRPPVRVAFGMHFVDYLVHAWDVGMATGGPVDLDDDLCAEALRIALRWPYARPDKAFGVKVDVPDDAPAQTRLVAYLGRSPGWAG